MGHFGVVTADRHRCHSQKAVKAVGYGAEIRLSVYFSGKKGFFLFHRLDGYYNYEERQ